MPEVIENQRWYPIVGWSARLHAEDPPAWCTAQQSACPSKDEQKEFVWVIYKGEDYDEEGWLYGEKFNDTLGPMTRSSVVRTRVWMGSKADEQKEVEAEVSEAENATSGREEAAVTGDTNPEWQTLFPSGKKDGEATDEAGSKTEVENTLFPSTESGEKKDNVLFPSAEDTEVKESKRGEPARSSGFFGRISSAVVSLPSSAINLAGSSSKQAVYGTVQSIKEASLFGLEMAQAATAAAISAEPQIPSAYRGRKHSTKSSDEESDSEVLSMLSKRFPDLSPVERSLVTCCEGSIPKFMSPPELTESKYCKECSIEFGMTKFRYQC
ncbi:Hypothetical protein PHPALM_2313, partial [Phytophthora palmivora]